jgi:hypothetical protein
MKPPLSRRSFLGAAGASAAACRSRPAAGFVVTPKAIDDAVPTAMNAWSVPGARIGVE